MGKGVYMKAIGPLLIDSSRRRNKFLHIEGLPEVIDKRSRATSIRGRMRAGGVRFNKKGKWYPIFEQELLEFDRGEHDDQVDTMSLFGMFIDKLIDAPNSKEIEELEYDEEFNDHNWQKDTAGRNWITGY
jgi:predicted phage terminase large subunit-like protein